MAEKGTMTSVGAGVDINHFEHGQVLGSYSGATAQRISFGECNTGCCMPVITTRGASGHVTGYEMHWAIANHSPHSPLVVRHAERSADRITIKPGQGDTIVPFDIAEVVGAQGHVLTVLGAGPGAGDCNAPCAGDIPVAWGLNPDTTYFKVMITAVWPIVGGTDDPLPTAAEIAEELGLTMSQLYDHLTHLIRLLNLTPRCEDTRGPWRLATLATYAREHIYIPPTLGRKSSL